MTRQLLREGEVPIRPFGKARPRVTRYGTFMPDDYEASRQALMLLFGGKILTDKPLHLSVVAVRSMPKSWSRGRRRETDGQVCLTKPDLDNILGAVMDAILDKDSNVVSLEASKVWGFEDALRIAFYELA